MRAHERAITRTRTRTQERAQAQEEKESRKRAGRKKEGKCSLAEKPCTC
jgi:hypothetical protein